MPIIKKYTTKNIFISSTFIDMQLERDILSKKVLPLVKEFALKYYINIEFVDLRFGIDIGNKNLLDKVINTCSDEIVRCKPLFIGFLGNRFGTEIENSNESITSFEIHKAISENCECLYYFRNITNLDSLGGSMDKYFYNDEKVNDLKNELLDSYPQKCRSYDSFYDPIKEELVIDDSFVSEVANDINLLIKDLYEEEAINNSLPHFEYLSFLHKDYIDVDEDAHYFLSKIFLFDEKIDLFIGHNGNGKSLLIANLVKENENDSLILPFYTAVSDELSLIYLLNNYIEMMKRHLGESYEFIFDEEETVDTFYQLLSRINKKCMLVIDDYKYIKDGKTIDKYSWIRVDQIPNNVRFLIATSSGMDAEKLEIDSYVWHSSQVNYRICKKFLDGYLLKINQKVSKEFYDMLFKELLDKANGKSIMYLKIYLDYIFFNDRHDAMIINKLSNEVKDNDLTNVDRAVLDFYTDKIKNMDEKLDLLLPKLLNKKLELLDNDLANLILVLIATMENGVKESDIIEIAKLLNIQFVANEFAYLRKILPSYFYQQQDGSWIIPNYTIKTSLKNHFKNNKEYIKKVNNAILKYLCSLSNSNDFKLINIMPLLYENNEYALFKEMLLYLIDNEKTQYVDNLLLDIVYRIQDFDFLEFLIVGPSYKKQEQINCYISNLICNYSFVDYDIFVDVLPHELEERIDSNSRGIRYLFASINLELCIFNHDDEYIDILNDEFMDLYQTTKNKNIKLSIINNYFKMIELSTYKPETKKLIKALFKILDSVEVKDKAYYRYLCKAYIIYMKLEQNNIIILNKYLPLAITIIDNGYADYKITNEVIDLIFKVFGYEMSNQNYEEAYKAIKTIKRLILPYQYKERSIEALDKMLIIDYFLLIVKTKLGIFDEKEYINLKKEFEELDIIERDRDLPAVAEFYLLALTFFDSNITNDTNSLYNLVKWVSNRISISDEYITNIYTLVFITLEFINHINKNNVVIDNKKVLKDVIKLMNSQEHKNDLYVKRCKQEIILKI